MPPAAQQFAAPHAFMQQSVIELSDSDSQSLDCMDRLSHSSSDNEDTPHAVKQELPGQAIINPMQCLEVAIKR